MQANHGLEAKNVHTHCNTHIHIALQHGQAKGISFQRGMAGIT
jgi:hypothetical protein